MASWIHFIAALAANSGVSAEPVSQKKAKRQVAKSEKRPRAVCDSHDHRQTSPSLSFIIGDTHEE